MNVMLPRMGQILLNILINRLRSREKHMLITLADEKI